MLKRCCHIVFNVGNLRKAIECLDKFGFRVLRHEEFEVECEASCNGPYEGHWSKTMVGAHSEDQSFVLELTYNYGVDSYPSQNAVQSLVLRTQNQDKFKPLFVAADSSSSSSSTHVIDGFCNNLRFTLESMPDSFPSASAPIAKLCLRSSNLAKTKEFWCNLLNLDVFEQDETRLLVGCSKQDCLLEFELTDEPIALCPGTGRIAFDASAAAATTTTGSGGGGSDDEIALIKELHEQAVAGNHRVLKEPVSLPTPGKADVTVLILCDPDGHEVCVVGRTGFVALMKPFPSCFYINWEERERKMSQIVKFREQMNKRKQKK